MESLLVFHSMLLFISGGFDGTSNVLAGKLFNIPVKGTHAHAYVTSFTGAEDLANAEIKHKSEDYVEKNFYEKCLEWRTKLAAHLKIMRDEAHDGELAAFASYAIAFPQGFMALVDTYDVSRYRLDSALINDLTTTFSLCAQCVVLTIFDSTLCTNLFTSPSQSHLLLNYVFDS